MTGQAKRGTRRVQKAPPGGGRQAVAHRVGSCRKAGRPPGLLRAVPGEREHQPFWEWVREQEMLSGWELRQLVRRAVAGPNVPC